MSPYRLEKLRDDDVYLDALPNELVATIQVRNDWINRLMEERGGREFYIADLQKWTPNQRLRVAFLGGDPDLHRDIAEATEQLSNACSIELDFGYDENTGTYRTWSETDQSYSAEIRVSFDQDGYWSLVGTDSIDPTIAPFWLPYGGRPGQRSLNLEGFHIEKPSKWRGVVRHEFLHALAFKHSHQNMRSPCEEEFRWEDDAGYEPTTDADGRYIPDANGRRPGIYTYLAGYPNHWTKETVDHNLRTEEDPDTIAGPFDRESVMLYRFQDFFYKSDPSPCSPIGDGIDISEGDQRGLQLLYPAAGPDLEEFVSHRRHLLEMIQPAAEIESGMESTSATPVSKFAGHTVQMLADSLEKLR